MDKAAGKPAAFLFFGALAAAVGSCVDFVFVHFAAQGVAVDAEDFCGAGLIAVGALEGALDEFLFEFVDGFAEQDAALDHLTDEGFELFFHGRTLHGDASTHSLRGPEMDGPVINRVDGR